MGVPKFYRWISERYPCLSEGVKEFQLPEFDNLYLDMNGIIHVCSHPDDDNPHFRITEEKIFKDICHYIDFLFRMIKPRRVFYMAVDGVAPRAKMNQQRGRRFRSAREAESLIKKAEEKGEVLPTEQRFDSNCITPGTPFMVRLQEHLKYFVVDKVTHDPLWQGPQIYLSGHETPGEGEHKIMDFIRFSKSHTDYDPDTRHCLYGLDADLIMLGLTSHEPHFCLLREEVRFGGRRDRNKRPATPEETTFHLLHLSLMRDYLAYELADLQGKLPFAWDLERIIDDWILMGFLVGNDFIPHLPHLHIHHDALPLLWKTYKSVLPTLDGYINEDGHLNLPRFEKYFEELSKFDLKTFESAFSDLRFLESKLGGTTINESIGAISKAKAPMKKLEKFKVEKNGKALRALEDEGFGNDVESEESDDEESDEYSDEDDDYDTTGDEFSLHKRDYYMTKMDFPEVTPDVLRDQALGYVKAIQWILLYYFEGCPSWSWFYPHHYAPYISDVKGFSDTPITFDLGTPFMPFQQLMAVLPAASKALLPAAYQPLMTELSSAIIDFYPVDFETDLNGKQQDWEAVVLIPFIAERRLLEAMASKEHLLTDEERQRNRHGPHLMYQYTPDSQGPYPSSLPGVFPDIPSSKALLTELDKDLFHIESNRLRKGLLETVRLDVYFPGFPTLGFIPHTHELSKVGCKVFQHASRGENMTLKIQCKEGLRLEEVADELLGKVTHVGWPHMHEAKVVAVANESYRIELIEEDVKKSKKGTPAISFNRKKLEGNEAVIVAREATEIKERQMSRFAIDVGHTEIVVYACPMTGRTYTYGAHGTITLEKQFASNKLPFLHQMTVKDLQVEESGHTTFKTIEEVFPVGSTVFMMGNPHYGSQGKVLEVLTDIVRVRIALQVTEEPDFSRVKHLSQKSKYLNNYQAAQQIGIEPHIMSRITGTVMVERASDKYLVNIGLNLKSNKKGEEVPGYTRKVETQWCYSWKCVKLVEEYINKFQSLWTKIQQASSNTDCYPELDLFPEGSAVQLKDVVKYLEEVPSSKVPKMKCGAEILDDEQVEKIEEMTALLNPKPDTVKVKVKPRLLFRSLAKQGSLVPDPGTDFCLYDRIVVVKSGYSVPFGRRGTIIGIPHGEEHGITPNSFYDVVFDDVFTGGLSLRCSPGKGYRVPGSAMLNLTYGEFRKGQPHVDAVGERSQCSPLTNYNTNSGGAYVAGYYNNSNNLTRHHNDRMAPYNQMDKTAMWKQQQQVSQQFQQQPVKWDKGQPLFGQVFTGQNLYGQGSTQRARGQPQPQFVTPKVQGSAGVLSSRNVSQNKKTPSDNNLDENSEFSNLWRNLQTHQGSKVVEQTSTTTSQNPTPTLLKTQTSSTLPQSILPQQSTLPPFVVHSSTSQKPAATVGPPEQGASDQLRPQLGGLMPRVLARQLPMGVGPDSVRQSINSKPTVSGSENVEFLAVFNSLKLQNEEQKGSINPENRTTDITKVISSPVSSPSEPVKLPADLALKQLLKIGMGPSVTTSALVVSSATTLSSSVPINAVPLSHIEESHLHTASGTSTVHTPQSPAPPYGRHLSVQELFEEANRHQQKQEQQQPDGSVLGVAKPDNRDPAEELENYCKNVLNLGPPHYDYKLQPKQNAYIANVILANGQRYEGSLCKTKEEASKSAASMAILCLNSRPSTTHPGIGGYPSGAQRSNVDRFFSANSAFSPIGVPASGPAPNMIPQRPTFSGPLLLTPQHFINQPPPNISLHQLLQQQQQQQFQQPRQHNTAPGPIGPSFIPEHHRKPQHSLELQTMTQQATTNSGTAISAALTATATPTPASSSVIQQFVPLQVSRNQKTPSRRKDSESERSEGSSGTAKVFESGDADSYSASKTDLPAATTALGNPVIAPDRNGVAHSISTSLHAAGGTLSMSKSVPKPVSSSTASQSSKKKKKSRLAANFGTKLN